VIAVLFNVYVYYVDIFFNIKLLAMLDKLIQEGQFFEDKFIQSEDALVSFGQYYLGKYLDQYEEWLSHTMEFLNRNYPDAESTKRFNKKSISSDKNWKRTYDTLLSILTGIKRNDEYEERFHEDEEVNARAKKFYENLYKQFDNEGKENLNLKQAKYLSEVLTVIEEEIEEILPKEYQSDAIIIKEDVTQIREGIESGELNKETTLRKIATVFAKIGKFGIQSVAKTLGIISQKVIEHGVQWAITNSDNILGLYGGSGF
jgi:hypothetical protein